MASIFLSYVHEDHGRAAAVAARLERAGHSVWWDRHIKGGREFSSEIEQALAASDKIVVLWSERSIHSAWVRDEAAVGRDSGRLVPVAIDASAPPLGFRQFQTIDLADWKGRAPPPQIQDLLDAVGDAPPSPADSSAQRLTPPRRLSFKFPLYVTVGLGALAIALILGGWWWVSRSGAHAPIVAIESASDSPQSREVARELAIRLGELQSARSDAFQLMTGKDPADIRLQVNAADTPTQLRRDVSILSGNDGSILWSASLRQSPGKSEDLSEQLTLTSERLLSCALEALSDRKDRIDQATLKLYLSGCSSLQDVYGDQQYRPALESLLEQVVANAPHFAGAWAKLLASEAELVAAPDPPRPLVAKLRKNISAVERLGLNFGELYAAKAALLPANDFLRKLALYTDGIEANPDNALLYRVRAEELQRVGRMTDAVADAGRAAQLDPLSPALADDYASVLAYSGQVDAAYTQLQKAETIWPAASNLRNARFRLDLRFGDPKEAASMLRSGIGAVVFDPAMESFLEARIDPTPAKIQKAIDAERAQMALEPRYISGLLQALGQFGRKDEAIDVMLNYKRPDASGYNADAFFRPAMREVWRDPRSIGAAAHLGLLSYWMKSGRWPDFCADPTLPYDCRKEAAKYRV